MQIWDAVAGQSPLCPGSLQGLQVHSTDALPEVLLPSWGGEPISPKWCKDPGSRPAFDVLSCGRCCPVFRKARSPQATSLTQAETHLTLQGRTCSITKNPGAGATTGVKYHALVREGSGESSVSKSFRSLSWCNKRNLEVAVVLGFFFLLAF